MSFIDSYVFLCTHMSYIENINYLRKSARWFTSSQTFVEKYETIFFVFVLLSDIKLIRRYLLGSAKFTC